MRDTLHEGFNTRSDSRSDGALAFSTSLIDPLFQRTQEKNFFPEKLSEKGVFPLTFAYRICYN